jgi:hypothetical protein
MHWTACDGAMPPMATEDPQNEAEIEMVAEVPS